MTVEGHSQPRLPTGQFQRPHQVELGFQGWVGSQGKEQVQKPMGTSVRTTWFILLPQVRSEMRLDMRDRKREDMCNGDAKHLQEEGLKDAYSGLSYSLLQQYVHHSNYR